MLATVRRRPEASHTLRAWACVPPLPLWAQQSHEAVVALVVALAGDLHRKGQLRLLCLVPEEGGRAAVRSHKVLAAQVPAGAARAPSTLLVDTYAGPLPLSERSGQRTGQRKGQLPGLGAPWGARSRGGGSSGHVRRSPLEHEHLGGSVVGDGQLKGERAWLAGLHVLCQRAPGGNVRVTLRLVVEFELHRQHKHLRRQRKAAAVGGWAGGWVGGQAASYV